MDTARRGGVRRFRDRYRRGVPAGPDIAPIAASERRSRLLGVALTAIVRDHVGDENGPIGELAAFPPGAALRHGADAWVLLDDESERRLGSAVAWAIRSGASSLQVVARDGTGVLARRAAELVLPISVWRLDGASITPAHPHPISPAEPPPAEHLALVGLIEEGGASPVVEHGVVVGEVRGLEVCRVVDDPYTGAVRLEVGVGAHDREAFMLMYGDVPAVSALQGVVDAVTGHRVPGSTHPLARLAPERLLRWRLLEEPSRVGAVELHPAPPPLPRTNLKGVVSCTATGTAADGSPVIVVCSAGVDLDVVPYALDARLAASAALGEQASGPARPRTVVALPARDVVPLTREMAGLARDPLELVGLD
jgi:hypothetical protein